MLSDFLHGGSYPSLTVLTKYLCAYHSRIQRNPSSFSKTLQKSPLLFSPRQISTYVEFLLVSCGKLWRRCDRNEEAVAARSGASEHNLNPSSWEREGLKEFR